jgi:hypothetical protein
MQKLLLILLISILGVNFTEALCTAPQQAILDTYNEPTVLPITCDSNGTITFLEISGLQYSIDGGLTVQNESIVSYSTVATYNPYVQFASDPTCNLTLTAINGTILPAITGTVQLIPANCEHGWTFNIFSNDVIPNYGGFLYSINNGTTFQIENTFTGDYSTQIVAVVSFVDYPSCITLFNTVNANVPYGCPSASNCTTGSTFIQDPDDEFNYWCTCPATSNFNNFCGSNCYMVDGIPEFITLEGQTCDKRYIKVYDGPCCYDCNICGNQP